MWRSPRVIATEIRLKRQVHPSSSFVLVEGREDRLLFSQFSNLQYCELETANGKANVLEAIRILGNLGVVGSLGIVDVDFDLLEGNAPRSSNIVTSDCHDIEAMLIRSAALDRVLRELGSEQKMGEFVRVTGRSVREAIVEAAIPLGYLRWHSLKQKIGLVFEALNFSRFVDPRTLEVNTSSLVETVKDKSSRHDLNSVDLESAIHEMRSSAHDPWHVCNGHDLADVLSLGLRGALGSQRAANVRADALRSYLRLAYDSREFQLSELALRIKEWEGRNFPFGVL